MNPTCIAIRHVHAEDLGTFAAPIARRGYDIRYVEAPTAAPGELRAAARADLVVVLGGPIGAYESDLYPFIDAELALLRERIAEGRRTLGICLGAQLMASALGSRVYPGPAKELGWAPIFPDPDLPRDSVAHAFFQGDAEAMMLHWHGDTYDLPPGAVRLASSRAVKEQGFLVGEHAMAWQCHPEFSPASLEAWVVAHAHELGASGGAALVSRLRADTAVFAPRLVERGQALLDSWFAGRLT